MPTAKLDQSPLSNPSYTIRKQHLGLRSNLRTSNIRQIESLLVSNRTIDFLPSNQGWCSIKEVRRTLNSSTEYHLRGEVARVLVFERLIIYKKGAPDRPEARLSAAYWDKQRAVRLHTWYYRLRVSTEAVEQQARFSSRFGRVSLISKIEVLRGFSS